MAKKGDYKIMCGGLKDTDLPKPPKPTTKKTGKK